MKGINKNTYDEQLLSLSAGIVKEVDFKRNNPNVFIIRNISAYDIYLSESPQVSATKYYKKCLGNATTKYVSITGVSKLYLYCASSFTQGVIVQSSEQEELTSNDLDEDTNISAVLSGVTLGSVKIVDSGGTNQLAIDGSGFITAKLSGAIPAGSNVIGNVGLEAGSNAIGTVGLETGSNVIGSVKLVDAGGTNELAIDGSGRITTLSYLQNAIPAGANSIGAVSLNAGSNLIGGAKVIDGAGTNQLKVNADGSLDVNFSGTVSATSVQLKDETDTYYLNIDSSGFITAKLSGAIPAGSNVIGNVGLESGTNNIGDVDIETIASGQNVKPATSPVVYNVTCVVAGTEYSQALPAGCKKFSIGLQSKNSNVIWVLKFGTSGTEFSLTGDETVTEDNILCATQTLYFESDTAGEIIQIMAWS